MSELTYPSAVSAELERRLPPELVEAYLPRTEDIDLMVHVAFFASLQKEEQRSIRFSLAFTKPWPKGVTGGSRWDPAVFSEPRALTVTEVVKLASALDPRQSAIGLCVGASGKPGIWGILNQGLGRHRFDRGERGVGRGLPVGTMPFIVKAREPGRLDVSLGDFWAFRFQGGAISDTPLPLFADLGGPTYLRMSEWAVGLGIPEHRVYEYSTAVRRLVRLIHESGHGGTLVILGEPGKLDGIKLGRNTFSSPGHHSLRTRLQRCVADLQKQVEDCLANGGKVSGTSVGVHPQEELGDELEDSLRATAQLAAVDGALIMTRELVTTGFGAKIDWSASDHITAFQAMDTRAVEKVPFDLLGRGTRHQSGAWLASRRPDAMVFVQSEDGDLSCMLNAGDPQGSEVLVWKGVEPDYEATVESLIKGTREGFFLLPSQMRYAPDGSSLGPSYHGR